MSEQHTQTSNSTYSNPVFCKFYRIGTCTKGKKCPFIHDRDTTELVCSFYQQGQCRYGDYCALPHIKQKSTPPAVTGFLGTTNASKSTGRITTASPIVNGQTAQSVNMLTPKSMDHPPVGASLLIPPKISPSSLRDRTLSISSSFGAENYPYDNLQMSAAPPSYTETLPNQFDEGHDEIDEEETLSDIPFLPSLLDDLLTPTERLQLSNSRGNSGESHSVKPSAGVFSYSAITKVGISSKKHSAEVPSISAPPASSTSNNHMDNSSPTAQDSITIESLPEPEGPYYEPETREPLCPFAIHSNCRFGDSCRYIHGQSCPVCKKSLLHPNASLDEHFAHVTECQRTKQRLQELQVQTTDIESSQRECVVCMEVVYSKKDPRFGIMNCDHCVCLECIRKWRLREGMDTSKTCPICRVSSHFVTPSTIWPPDEQTKQMMIEQYKSKLANIDCRHFNFGEGNCPFGTSCFYRHVDRAGQSHDSQLRVVKGDGEDVRVVGRLTLSDYLERYDATRNR